MIQVAFSERFARRERRESREWDDRTLAERAVTKGIRNAQ